LDNGGRQNYQYSSLHYFAASSLALHGLLLTWVILLPPSPEPLPKKQLAAIELALLPESVPKQLSGDRPSNLPHHSTPDNPNNQNITATPQAIAPSTRNTNRPSTVTPSTTTETTSQQPDKTPPQTRPATAPSTSTSTAAPTSTTSTRTTAPATTGSPGKNAAPGTSDQTGTTTQTGGSNNFSTSTKPAPSSQTSTRPVPAPPPKPAPPPSPPPAPAPKPQNVNCVQGCGDRHAQLNGQKGVAGVRIEIDPSGRVVSATITASTGNPNLDRLAITEARKMGFDPRESTTNEFRSVRIPIGS
jgi:TonB family protein